jgi:hypothetical protein
LAKEEDERSGLDKDPQRSGGQTFNEPHHLLNFAQSRQHDVVLVRRGAVFIGSNSNFYAATTQPQRRLT